MWKYHLALLGCAIVLGGLVLTLMLDSQLMTNGQVETFRAIRSEVGRPAAIASCLRMPDEVAPLSRVQIFRYHWIDVNDVHQSCAFSLDAGEAMHWRAGLAEWTGACSRSESSTPLSQS